MTRLRMAFASIILMLLSVTSCQKLFPVDSGVGTGKGIVRRVDTVHHLITLSHGTVGTILHPMTYAYPVKSNAMMKNFAEGDSVNFSIHELKPGVFLVESLTKRGKSGGAKTKAGK